MEYDPVEMKQVSDNCFAVLNEKNRVCDANSGLINRAGGFVIDTQSDLAHARRMIEMFSKVWPAMPRRVINTHEDADHVWGGEDTKRNLTHPKPSWRSPWSAKV